MHLLFRERVTLDEDQPALDLAHAPADIVFLSFSDSDLGAAAAAWAGMGGSRPSLRLANLAQLRHPMSVDLYADRTIAQARCVILRVLGGLDYVRYGAEEFAQTCLARSIPIALLPGDARDDSRLAALSTVPTHALSLLDAYFAHGGPDNIANALRVAAHLAGIAAEEPAPPAPVPQAGEWVLSVPDNGTAGRAAIVFYRSHLLAGDIAPIAALAEALSARGLGVRAFYVSSLKDPVAAETIIEALSGWPGVVLSATGFSAGPAVLGVADAPVLQVVFAGSERAAWLASARGLSQTDLAMQVVLPELDGRLLTGAVSFKAEATPVPGLDFAQVMHRPDADGIALAADRAAGWARLAGTPRAQRRIALVLSNYPGGQEGHAIGLDTFASLAVIGRTLAKAGYDVRDLSEVRLHTRTILSPADYARLFATLPEAARLRVLAAWGEPADDIAVRCFGDARVFVALQPDRGHLLDRKSGYHDPDLPPCHTYIGFYLWLRHLADVHAVVHLGAHGTLEWLPGKATALSTACFPAALLGGLPLAYPFIVNNPGEAAAAKRRLGAVTIGHLTPKLLGAGAQGPVAALERMIDAYAAADGLDRRRASLLRNDVLRLARDSGVLAESGVAQGEDDHAALARLDAYLCDVKELRIRDGLHVYGTGACGAEERSALIAALDGRFVEPGPAGAPSRGRADVLPTGRNLYAVDPRAVPTREALALAERAATELLRRHLQDHGDWPRVLVLDLWGSTTMRTGGEDLALALVLMGARPVWDEGSARVSGIEILPLAMLDRPRVDVTLRVSGLFRDAFEAQIALFDQAVRAIAGRDFEDAAMNPLARTARVSDGNGARSAPARIFGPAPGAYGAGVLPLIERGAWRDRDALGAAYLAASSHAYGRDLTGDADSAAFAERVAEADAFVHTQDHTETDVLDNPETASHEGGFASAATSLRASPALYRLDTSSPDLPRARTLREDIARVVRGRAANPAWIAGMKRHGRCGATEIARTLDALYAFAATTTIRFDAQFELMFSATIGDADTDAFLRTANPEARAAMLARFEDARERGLWHSRRNDPGASGV